MPRHRRRAGADPTREGAGSLLKKGVAQDRADYREAMQALRTALARVTTPVDLALAGALGLLAGIETASVDGEFGLRALLATATALSLAGRRRTPAISALLVATGVAVESVATESPDQAGVMFAVLISTFSVAAYASVREALLGLGIMSMALAVSITVDPSDSVSNIPPTVGLFVVVPAVVGFAFHRRGEDLAAMGLRAAAAERERELAVESERRRLARELHDMVSHAVTLIAIQAEGGKAVLDDDPAAARRSFEAISTSSQDVVAELQTLLELLDEPAAKKQATGLGALSTLVAGVRAAGLSVAVDETGDPVALASDRDACAYRVVQEGLTNALRHNRHPRVELVVEHHPGCVRITVATRGTPHQSTYGGTGRGLAGLRERIAVLGGSIEVDATHDSHRLVATIPREAR